MLLHLKLRRLESLLQRRLDRYLEVNTGLTTIELAVLVTASEQLASQIELSQILDIHPNSMSQIVKRLQDKNYIRRMRDPNDTRRLLVGLTDTGNDVARQVKRNRQQLYAIAFSPLSDEQINEFEKMVTKLLDSSHDIAEQLEGLGSRLLARKGVTGVPPRRSSRDERTSTS